MEPKRMNCTSWQGTLPARAPLANPYVPMQAEDPPMYDARKALIRGTLFPGLDLPFRGMVNTREQPMTPLAELQALNFAIQELALYLDTHRKDRNALALYRQYQQVYAQARQEYCEKHRPLDRELPRQGSYAWTDGPWPWEFAANKEG